MMRYVWMVSGLLGVVVLIGCGQQSESPSSPPPAPGPTVSEMVETAEEPITEANMEQQLKALEAEINADDGNLP